MIENSDYLKVVGSRILSEANDLKRTVAALAKDLNMKETFLKKVIVGKCTEKETLKVIKKMGKIYPIDSSDLVLIKNDCKNGLVYFSAKQSLSTSRIFNRKDKNNLPSPFYEYRDTAMSKIAPFKPEWIKELRVVENSDPNNPDVAYNNGHFMHQLTFFIGPVNFYYELNGKKYCKEMNTGDSNYITPYLPHTFTSRDKSKEAYIIAVTFGGDVRRSQKELYSLGEEATLKYQLDIKDIKKATSQLIFQHMKNGNITREMIKDEIDIDTLLDYKTEKSYASLSKISEILKIDISDLLLPLYNKKHEVAIFKKKEQLKSFYPSCSNKLYKIYNLVEVNKMPNLKGFHIKVLNNKVSKKDFFETSLHNYIYNYWNIPVKLIWIYNGKKYEQILKKDDSVYLQPFIPYAFVNIRDTMNAKLFNIRVGGSINFSTQKELSYFTDGRRVANENKVWFD